MKTAAMLNGHKTMKIIYITNNYTASVGCWKSAGVPIHVYEMCEYKIVIGTV